MGLLERARNVVGARLVRFGLAVLGYKAPANSLSASPVDEDDDDGLPPNVPSAILSDEAKAMIATPGWTARPIVEEPPLSGSLADRQRAARREMGSR